MGDRIAHHLDLYRAQIKASLALLFQYRFALAIWILYTVLQPTIFLAVWSAVARSGGGSVGGFAPGDFATYFIVTMWVGHLTFTWVMFENERRVRTGEFSPKLLRPVHPIHADLAENLVYKAMNALVLGPATVGMVLLFEPRLDVVPWSLALFLPALLLAFWLNFLLGWTLSCAAFWVTRVSAINEVYFVAALFTSGQMVPIALLPGPLQTLTWLLPFRWMIAFPAELFMGRLTPAEAWLGLAVQAVWAVVVFGLFRLVWRRAVRQYTAVGA